MNIDTFDINCTMGKSKDWSKLDLTQKQYDFINDVGFKGIKKMGYTMEEYLNEIHKDKYQYKIVELSSNSYECVDKYLVIRVSLGKIKTFEAWKGDLDTYLQVGDLVDDEMVNHFLGAVPPATNTESIIQLGEEVRGETYYTLLKTKDVWKYAGICFKGKTENIM